MIRALLLVLTTMSLASFAYAGEIRHEDMVFIKPGIFLMGSNEKAFADAKPVHEVQLKGFWLDKTEVTNGQFAQFVKATGYKTVAEQTPKKEDFPGVPVEKLVPGSLVFTAPKYAVSRSCYMNWWHYIEGANWQHPYGPKSNIKGKDNYPVVQIAYDDALAYAQWAGKRLPTEAEFEFAQCASNEVKLKGKWQANIFQGIFPCKNTKEDGFVALAPVGSYAANNFGLFDMTGNVWEWCSDWYRTDYYCQFANAVAKNPQGPETSFDPDEPKIAKRVQKGGSYLCTDQYCARYKKGARGKGEPNSPCDNVGFRCAMDADEAKN